MRTFFIFSVIGVLTAMLAACADDQEKGQTRPEELLATISGQFSYAMGHDTVVLMRNVEAVTFEQKAFLLGVTDTLEEKELRLSQVDMDLVKRIVGRQERDLRNEQIKQATRANKAQQEKVLAENCGTEGVVVTDSGLQYRVIVAGNGDSPKLADVVRVHMKVSLPDGTVLDSTYQNGRPVLIKVDHNLPGYQEALQVMQTGAQYRFWIPYQLAYGEQGNYGEGGRIGPCQMLILDLELLEIVDQANSSNETAD